MERIILTINVGIAVILPNGFALETPTSVNPVTTNGKNAKKLKKQERHFNVEDS